MSYFVYSFLSTNSVESLCVYTFLCSALGSTRLDAFITCYGPQGSTISPSWYLVGLVTTQAVSLNHTLHF